MMRVGSSSFENIYTHPPTRLHHSFPLFCSSSLTHHSYGKSISSKSPQIIDPTFDLRAPLIFDGPNFCIYFNRSSQMRALKFILIDHDISDPPIIPFSLYQLRYPPRPHHLLSQLVVRKRAPAEEEEPHLTSFIGRGPSRRRDP